MADTEKIRIEVEEDHLLLVFLSRRDNFGMLYQEAWVLGDTLEQAAKDIPVKPEIVNPVQGEFESQKFRLNRHSENGKEYIWLFFDHTDRIKLSPEAARIVARSIRQMAQDIDLKVNKLVHISYDEPGRKGRPTPMWDKNRLAKTFGLHTK